MPGRTGYRTGILLALTLTAAAQPAVGPLRVHLQNPRYFDDGTGKAVYLTGSHNWWNLQDSGTTDPPPPTDYSAYLDFLVGYGHNFTRGWAWEQAKWMPSTTADVYITPLPFQRPGPGIALDGKPKFDLTLLNPAYFERIRARAIEAGNRGIYMSIMLFEGWSYKKPFQSTPGNPWPGHPFNQANNINGINGDPNGNNDGIETQTLQIPAITALQEAYVRRMIDTLNDVDNIFWEISNESHESSLQWQYHMIDYIHAYEATRPKQHLVWMTAAPITNAQVDASNADVVAHKGNGADTIYRTDPPATTGNKIQILDTDHVWGIGGDRDWIWKCITRGYHPAYMDPIYDVMERQNPDDPMFIRARQAMGQTLTYANRMNLANVVPQPSTTTSPSSTRYCLYSAGAEYLVLQPTSGPFTLDLSPALYDYEWFNPATGTVAATDLLVWRGGVRTFTPPFSGLAVLYVKYTGPPPAPGDLDLDGDVDQSDYGIFQECFSGSLAPYAAGCEPCDLDSNGAVDQMDAAMFLECAGGANRPPGC